MQSAMEVFQLKGLVAAAAGRSKMSAQALSTELLKLGLQQAVGGNAKLADDEEGEGGSLTPGFIWASFMHP